MTTDTMQAQLTADDEADLEASVTPAGDRITTDVGPADAAANGEPAAQDGEEPAARRRGRPKGSGVRKTRTVELTLTVSGTADGDWEAELRRGNTWIARGLPIPAAAVSRAAKELHEDLSGPIDEVIHAARNQHRARVAALEAELEQARRALAELAD